jgi:dihydrofolate synthase / folylpolyglutamate synthase
MVDAADSPAALAAVELEQACQRLDKLMSWERSDRRGMQMDLAPSFDLMARLGNPHRRFRSVHVTGTKGKGSVCALVEAGLVRAGLRVGRYASPHVQHISERISIGGRPIGDQDLALALSAALDAREQASLEQTAAKDATWFDVLTAAAFVSFDRAAVAWVVVEVGMGGRLDSTNVVESDVAVITNIGLEHTDVLGDTIEKIATEKAGIIKPGCTVVTPIPPDHPAGQVIWRAAGRIAAPVRQVPVPTGATLSLENLATARSVLNALGGRGVSSIAREGLVSTRDLPAEAAERVRLPGRLERFRLTGDDAGSGLARDVVLDGAHVDFALVEVLRELRTHGELRSKPVVLLALGSDKNARAFAAALAREALLVVCTRVRSGRPGMDASVLAAAIREVGLPTQVASNSSEGFARCRELATSSWILVTGSFYLVSEIRAELTAAARSSKP